MKRTLYLIRHGATGANLENRFAGRSPEPLHPTGIKQIKKVGTELESCKIKRIFCAPLSRTRQTAEILQNKLNIPVTVSDGLTEINIPHWDGLTKQEIREKFGAEYPTWLNSPEFFALPGCETLAEVQERSRQALITIVTAEPAGNLLIVSHLIVIRCLVLYFKDMALQDFRTVKIDNGSVVRLTGNSTNDWSVSL
jgi:broad specificity phosphatase PhoE